MALHRSFQFHGTVEFLLDQRAAIVSLTDGFGEWAGGGRVDVRHVAFETTEELRSRLYEAGYLRASQGAMSHGGRLETYRVYA
jgi:hypothetical protein